TVTGNGTAWTDTPIDTDPDAAVTYHITAPEGVTIEAAPGSGGSLTDDGNGSYTLLGGNAVTIIGARIGIKGLYEVADGTTYTLKSDLLIKYSLADARVGDFYCKNSSGEGYLIPGDIAQLTEERQAACIGIVYSTDVNRIGKAAKEVLTDKGITPHGLVMALTNASNSCNWGKVHNDENSNGSEGEPFKENTDKVYKMYKNVDGYGETHWIIDTYGNDGTALPDTYTAFYHASRYGTAESNTGKYAAPSNTTGWFIPSMGQWWDILSNLGKIDLTSYRNSADSYADIGSTVPTAVDNINTYLQKISDATPFSTNTYFCSSSEHAGFSACNVRFNSNGDLGLHYSGKDRSDRRLRCSFAF
ncbi:conserved domain protein, partial [Bacteroides fluxus YIT 12057]